MKRLLILVSAACLVACGNHPEQESNVEKTTQTQEIYPVTSFVKEQLHLVDSLQLPVLTYLTVNNKTDTALVSTREFQLLAKEFLEPDITDPSFKKYYTETSFADQSIPSVTLTYSATRKDLEIQRLDVIIHPDPVLNDKVNSIYIEKSRNRGDTSILKKLYWKANKNFQVITGIEAGGRPATVTIMKVVWDAD